MLCLSLLLLIVSLSLALPCNEIPFSDIECEYSTGSLSNCTLGESYVASCSISQNVTCTGSPHFSRSYICQPCFFTDPSLCDCQLDNSYKNCLVTSPDRVMYNCTVDPQLICIRGDQPRHRSFSVFLPCRRYSEYKRSTLFWVSLFFGGFGVDRIYLGYTASGIAKGATLGGLGIWTLIDLVLVITGYMEPSDGSLLR
ncbi:hypothetical protein GEMRC1_006505 [Eukaryota sp. GEM-RC1]